MNSEILSLTTVEKLQRYQKLTDIIEDMYTKKRKELGKQTICGGLNVKELKAEVKLLYELKKIIS